MEQTGSHEKIAVKLFRAVGRALWLAWGFVRNACLYGAELGHRYWHRRIPKLAALPVFCCCLVGGIELIFAQLGIVYVTDSGQSSTLLTRETDAGRIAQMSGLTVGKYDECYYTGYEGNHAVIAVQRAYEVTVSADGRTYPVYLNGGTAEDALRQAGVVLGADDYTQPSPHTTLAKGDQVTVHRVTYTDTVVESAIPFEIEYRYSSLLYRNPGRTYVMRDGVDGTLEKVYRERRVDGVVESSTQIDEYVTKQPISQEVLAYQEGAPVSAISTPEGYSIVNNAPSSYRYMISNAVCTGYWSARGRGASRLGLYPGTVAVNPNKIPYGTLMYITSADGRFVYGWAIATDTGTALMEGIIDLDLFYGSYMESVMNGKKLLNVYIVR